MGRASIVPPLLTVTRGRYNQRLPFQSSYRSHQRLKIHEYQAKELLAAAGANVPRHIVVRTPEEAAPAFDTLGGTGAMVKAQIHAGGRGAGQLMGYPDKLGGVKFAPTATRPGPRRDHAQVLHSSTKQTGPEGQKIKTLIVQADAEPAKEYYVAMVFDRGIGHAGAHGQRRRRHGHRGSRARNPRENPQDCPSTRRPDCSRSRPGAWPSTSASPATRSPRPRRS